MNVKLYDQIASEKIAGRKERNRFSFYYHPNNNCYFIIYLFNSFVVQEQLNMVRLSGLLDAMKAGVKQ